MLRWSWLRRLLPARSAGRRRDFCRPRVEQLEDRALLANLTITNLEFVSGYGTPIASPAVGEMVFVRATWNAVNMSLGDQYFVRFVMDGITLDSGTLTATSADTFGLTWTRSGWYASPGSHTLTARVDGGTDISETSESDNLSTLNFTPTHQSPPQKLASPLVGTWYQDFAVSNYLDVDPRGTPRDYQGGSVAYDAHDAYDLAINNFAAMDATEPVVAAADGTVVAIRDGEYDRQTSGAIITANSVIVDHGQGWRTIYWHLRRDSVAVKAGDTVQRGDLLGYVGSSGRSTGPHLHFHLEHNGAPVETFYDPLDYWQTSPGGYVFNQPYVIGSGVTNYNAVPHNAEGFSAARVLNQASGQTSYANAKYSGLTVGDVISAEWWQPNGVRYATRSDTFALDAPFYSWYFASVAMPSSPMLGTWEVRFLINGQTQKVETFDVTTAGAPEVMVQQASGQLIGDGRYTPFDLGTVALNAVRPSVTFTVINHGSAPLNLSGLTVPPNYTIVNGLLGTLAPGAQDTFIVSLITTTAGNYAGQIRFTTNDADEPEYTIPIEGKVQPATGVSLVLGIADRSLAEGGVTVANLRRRDLPSVFSAPAVVVSLSASVSGQVSLPATVTIPAGQDYVSFPIQALGDATAESLQTIRITATATGYGSGFNELDVLDGPPVSVPVLALSLSQGTMSELGGSVTGTVTRSGASNSSPLTVSLASTDTSEASVPAQVTIPANQASATFTVTAVDDTLLDGTQSLSINASATGYPAATQSLQVTDHETLSVSLTPGTISELNGTAVGTVTRSNTDTTLALSVTLGGVDPTEATFPTSVTILSGQASATFNITAVDDALLDGTQTVTVSATATGYVSGSQILSVTDQEPPTISNIANQNVNEDHAGLTIPFVVGDSQESAASLVVSGTSSNTTVVPNANITFGGSGANRTVTIKPAAEQSGTATITITVNDGFATASDTFQFVVAAVNDAPTITSIANPTIVKNSTTGILFFQIGDVETAAASLVLSKSSTNTTLVPAANIVFGGSDTNRTVTVTPATNQFGTATITLGVSDGTTTTTTSFLLTVINQNDPPTVATAAAATPSTVVGTTTNLSVLGADDSGEAGLTYTWAVISKPPSAPTPTFSANGTNAAKSTVASFAQAGAYTFQATLRDAGSLTATSSVSVTVNATVTSIAVTPPLVAIDPGATQQYAATARDQFGNLIASPPAFTWSVASGSGTISAVGLYTSVFGPFQVRAAIGPASGIASGIAGNTAPTVATPAAAARNPAAGITTPLSVLGADDNGEANLTYSWSVLSVPSGAPNPTFSLTGTNAAKNTAVTVGRAGTYQFRATIFDGWLQVTSDTTLVVDYTLGQNIPKPADVTGDGLVNASDILAIVNYIITFGTGASSPTPPAAENPKICRDVNADGIINAQDILGVVNFIIANPIGGSGGEGESVVGPVPPSRFSSQDAAEVPESLLATLAADVAHGRRRKSL